MRKLVCLLAFGLLACGQRPAPGGSAQATSSSPATSSIAVIPADSVTASPAGWTRAPVTRARAAAQAVLTAVAVAPEAGFDRVAFDFQPGLPGYRVERVTGPVHACGSGDPVELPGTAVLVVAFHGAAAHDEQGRVTVADRDRRPGLPALTQVKLFCDFEGDVSWALALPRATRFRVSESTAPARLTIDIEHPR